MISAQQKSLSFLRTAFREYYFQNSEHVDMPDRFSQREFGFTRLGERGMVRHLAFASAGELRALLVREAPSDVYCSNSIYRNPSAPMSEKGWLGASLIFDIDGKDLDLPCVPEHTYHVCETCDGHVAESDLKSGTCRTCGNSGLLSVSVPCSKCVKAAKHQVAGLIDFLVKDVGIGLDQIATFFSGNNGFHLHISNPLFELLDSAARADLASYILGRGIIPESFGVIKAGGGAAPSFRFRKSLLEYGWRERISKKIDLTSPTKVTNQVEKFGGYSGLKKHLQEIATSMGVRIDPQVTSDIHRIFRMQGTINSKSGLVKAMCFDLEEFDPFSDACLLGDDPIAVNVKCPVHLRLKKQLFKLSKENVELPTFAAAYLICKGLALA